MSNILIIEDEKTIRKAVSVLLRRNGYSFAEAGAVSEALEHHDPKNFDLILSDLRLPGAPGTDIIPHAGNVPVLIMTSYASVESAVDAMRLGAGDYIAKPFDHAELLHSIERLLEKAKLERQNAALRSDLQREYPVSGIIGNCKPMQEVFGRINRVAPTDTTVLILGESGTGKELVARAVHDQSTRSKAPLIAVNCAAIPENLIESELFGHARGAFTGAVSSRAGLVEAANGGTLFLDEIGELSLPTQAQLLRVIQDGEVRRLGSTGTTKVDVRLIAATNRNLAEMVSDGSFREDLYYRLRVVEVHLPPLRERDDDVIDLSRYMLDKACQKMNRANIEYSPTALAAIAQYHWPGNVRELENCVERAVILCDGNTIDEGLLALDPVAARTKPAAVQHAASDMSLDEYFRHFVISNQDAKTETEMSKILGISRKSLWERRQRLGIPKSG